MQRLKKGDEVIVVTGKDKGKIGTIDRFVIKKQQKKVVVEGINLVKKHVKPNPQAGEQGGIVDREAALDISNVMLYNPESKKGDKVGFRFEDGKKVRFFKSTNEVVK